MVCIKYIHIFIVFIVVGFVALCYFLGKDGFSLSDVTIPISGVQPLSNVPPSWFPPRYPSVNQLVQSCDIQVLPQPETSMGPMPYYTTGTKYTKCPNDCTGRGYCLLRGFCSCDKEFDGQGCEHRNLDAYVSG